MFNDEYQLERLAAGVLHITDKITDDPFSKGPQVGTGKYGGITLNNADEAKLLLTKEIAKKAASQACTEARSKVVAGYDEYERDSWPIKKAESERVLSDREYVSSMLLAELDARGVEGETVQDLANIILENAAILSTAVSTIKGLQTNINNAIEQSDSEQDIRLAITGFKQKINSILVHLA